LRGFSAMDIAVVAVRLATRNLSHQITEKN